jgi:phosphopantothenoylcysteine synthetase/decarboxylase
MYDLGLWVDLMVVAPATANTFRQKWQQEPK